MTYPAIDETVLLHAGGPARRWGNLGLWPEAMTGTPSHYAAAAEALARRVAAAAGVRAGDRVLSVACGAGEEIDLWVDGFGAATAVGLERDPRRVRQARSHSSARPSHAGRITILEGSLDDLPCSGPGFERVVCIDAAYHFSPRGQFFEAAWARLRPGGTFAWTDLVLDERVAGTARRTAAGVGWLARRADIDLDEIGTVAATVARMERLGAASIWSERLDEAVLGGFARFARQQSRRLGLRAVHPAWWRVAGTAALIPWLRQGGLGYALFSASRPLSPPAASAGDA